MWPFRDKRLEGWYASIGWVEYSRFPRIYVYNPDGECVGEEKFISTISNRNSVPKSAVKKAVKKYALKVEQQEKVYFF